MKNLSLSMVFLIILILFSSFEIWAQWTNVLRPNTFPVLALASSDTNVFAGFGSYNGRGGGVYRSTDNGETWIMIDNELVKNGQDTIGILHLAAMGNVIIAGSATDGIFISTNNGDNWRQSNNGIEDSMNQVIKISAIGTNDSIIYAGVDNWKGAFVSTDTGKTWEAINNGLRSYNGAPTPLIYNFAYLDQYTYAFSSDGLYYSTNGGSNWMLDSTLKGRESFASIGDVFFWGVDTNIIRLTYDRTSWKLISAPRWAKNNEINLKALASYNNIIIAGGFYGVYFSNDSGSTWNSLNEGWNIYDAEVYSLTVTDSYLFAGTNGFGVWRIPLSQLITSVENTEENLPVSYFLQQNYPNPFNPSTTIEFTLPKASFVTLKVYDVLGKELKTLVSEEKPAGIYKVNFNAIKFTSGVYFYQLKTNSMILTKNMVLLR
jgi:photosystem II stability/assembly factor-like uncharacterized protein